ncbi:MAG: hypothetical protein HY878_00175 [Deltaproteobacteria bacterium]|nr:hypothetical protein [Deltaproteobacteria bacterium]
MRTICAFLVLALLLLVSPPGYAETQVDIGVSLGEEGLKGFYFAVGEYYKVPQKEVIIIKERRIRDEEIPVVLLIAKMARAAPITVINLRLSGKTWIDITLYIGLTPEIFYVPVKKVKGPPYGRAYGYYKNKPKTEWKAIILADDEVINLVNLKFISEYYGYSPEKVIEMRAKGESFVVINDEIRRGKQDKKDEKVKGGKHKGKGKYD